MTLVVAKDGFVVGAVPDLLKLQGGSLLAERFVLLPGAVEAITGPDQEGFSLLDPEHRPVYQRCYVSRYRTREVFDEGSVKLVILIDAEILYTGYTSYPESEGVS